MHNEKAPFLHAHDEPDTHHGAGAHKMGPSHNLRWVRYIKWDRDTAEKTGIDGTGAHKI